LIVRHAGKKQGISSNLAAAGENPSQKHLRIQQFARLPTMNSLCGGTGNQFGHNRKTNSRQQGIKSATSGNWARNRFSLDGSNDSIPVVPAKAARA
jgi:hypothetical protein